ncbi:MAG TPA: hypothetical protein DEO82_05770 [Eubacterium sp.]|nr:hypothetical protein [Eubacterium sp.]
MKIFKDGLFRANMKKVLLMIIAYVLITSVITLFSVASESYMFADSSLTGLAFAPGMMCGYLFLVFGCYSMAIYLFGYLMKRNESDFYGVLPYKRKTMFRKNMLTMYAVIVLILVINMFVLLVASLFVRGQMHIVWKNSWGYILAAVIAMILIANISAFAMSCSGNLRTAFLMTSLLLFGPRLLITSVVSTGNLLNGAIRIEQLVRILNPDINIISRALTRVDNMEFEAVDSMRNVSIWLACAYTAALALIYYILGERAYIKRDSEIAGTGGVGLVTYYFNKVFLGVLIMLIPICNNVSGPDLDNTFGVNVTQVSIFVAITLFVMMFYDAYIGRKGKRVVNLLYSSGAVAVCSLIILGIILGIKNYEWSYELNPNKIEGYSLNRDSYDYGDRTEYVTNIWVKPNSEVSKIIAETFKYQRKKVYEKDEYGDIYYDDPNVISYVSRNYSSVGVSSEDLYEELKIKYNGKIITIRVDDTYFEGMRKVYDFFEESETYRDARYRLPEKITAYNGKAIASVNYGDYEMNVDSKLYKTFKKEYYKLYDEVKNGKNLKRVMSGNGSVVSIMCEELVDGFAFGRSVGITKEDYPETYNYVWKRYVEEYYGKLKETLVKTGPSVPIKAYVAGDKAKEVKITYDQLLKILEAKDKEPKYMYTVVIGVGSNSWDMYISSPVELKPYTD